MGVWLGEAAVDGVVVAGAEVVLAGFGVIVLAAVAEGVGVCRIRVLFNTKSTVVVGLCNCTGSIGQIDHVAVGIIQVVGCVSAFFSADQVVAPEVGCGRCVSGLLVEAVVGVGLRAVGSGLGQLVVGVVGVVEFWPPAKDIAVQLDMPFAGYWLSFIVNQFSEQHKLRIFPCCTEGDLNVG